MKIVKFLSAFILGLALIPAKAQSDLPKGFKKGSLVLANSSLWGYVKDNLRSNASVAFIADTETRKIILAQNSSLLKSTA